jgi:carboxyl-terminal processing protease
LKVTTSKYYIPSGRCIQALDYSKKNNDGSAKKLPDSLLTEFKTAKGRIVYDGAGVTPDILVKSIRFHKISRSLVRNNLIFDYATEFRRKKESISGPDKFKFTDKDYEDFISFLSDKEYDYKTDSELGIESLRVTLESEKYYGKLKNEVDMLMNKLTAEKRNDLIDFKDEIIYLLNDEIISRYYFQKGRIIASIHNDAEVKKALEILKSTTEYKRILSPSFQIPKQDLSDEDDDIFEDAGTAVDDEE